MNEIYTDVFLTTERTNLGGSGEEVIVELALEAVFVHDPVTLLSLGGSPPVENQGFLHPDKRACSCAVDLPVLPGGLPVAGIRCAVRT